MCVCVYMRVFTRARAYGRVRVYAVSWYCNFFQSRMTLIWELSMRAGEEFYNIPSVILCMSCLLNIVEHSRGCDVCASCHTLFDDVESSLTVSKK